MTKMNTKLALAAALLAAGFATSAYADDSGLNDSTFTVSQQQQVPAGAEAYAYAPAAKSHFTVAEQRAFDRATAAALSQ